MHLSTFTTMNGIIAVCVTNSVRPCLQVNQVDRHGVGPLHVSLAALYAQGGAGAEWFTKGWGWEHNRHDKDNTR